MEYLIFTSRGKFGAETSDGATTLAFTFSSFEPEAVQVVHAGKPFAAYYEQQECVLKNNEWYWQRTVDGQFMERYFPVLSS